MFNSSTIRTGALAAAVAVIAFAAAPTAEASTVNDYTNVFTSDGPPPPGVNDCAGDLGTPPNCFWDGYGMVAKFDFNDAGAITEYTQGLFASITGAEFSFDFSGGVLRWFYTPDSATDPGITAFSVKGGPHYNVWEKEGEAFAGTADFATHWAPPSGGLSHITFYGTAAVAPIPLPAAGFLLLGALGGLGLVARRRKTAA